MTASASQHQEEILENLARWGRKPVLRRIYRDFYMRIARHLSDLPSPVIVEIGSGIGNIKEIIPSCIRTDLFPNPWIDRVENAYRLSFPAGSLTDLLLFDVFHHLRYPGTALDEFHRVLRPGGRVHLFEPCLSVSGLVVYGLCHHEPLACRAPIAWRAPEGWRADQVDYYAAQSNATRIFLGSGYRDRLRMWRLVHRERLGASAYIASGGYSGPKLYPDWLYPSFRYVDILLGCLPRCFATRLHVVLESVSGVSCQAGALQCRSHLDREVSCA